MKAGAALSFFADHNDGFTSSDLQPTPAQELPGFGAAFPEPSPQSWSPRRKTPRNVSDIDGNVVHPLTPGKHPFLMGSGRTSEAAPQFGRCASLEGRGVSIESTHCPSLVSWNSISGLSQNDTCATSSEINVGSFGTSRSSADGVFSLSKSAAAVPEIHADLCRTATSVADRFMSGPRSVETCGPSPRSCTAYIASGIDDTLPMPSATPVSGCMPSELRSSRPSDELPNFSKPTCDVMSRTANTLAFLRTRKEGIKPAYLSLPGEKAPTSALASSSTSSNKHLHCDNQPEGAFRQGLTGDHSAASGTVFGTAALGSSSKRQLMMTLESSVASLRAHKSAIHAVNARRDDGHVSSSSSADSLVAADISETQGAYKPERPMREPTALHLQSLQSVPSQEGEDMLGRSTRHTARTLSYLQNR